MSFKESRWSNLPSSCGSENKEGTGFSSKMDNGCYKKKKNKTMAEKLYSEIMDASQNKGSAIKKREDTHKMAESNKAFAHFRW